METCFEISESAAGRETVAPETARFGDHRYDLLRWLVDYELHAAERYRRYVVLMLVAEAGGGVFVKDLLPRVKRESDKLFVLENECAILMSETDQSGALVAVERYKTYFSEQMDARFSIVTFPVDGVHGTELLTTLYRRLNAAKKQEPGSVVSSG